MTATIERLPLSAAQIERRCERMIDHLDRLLLAGELSQKAYDSAMRDLDAWCERQYARPDRRRDPRTPPDVA